MADITLLSKYFKAEPEQILNDPLYKRIIKETFNQTIPNGIIDSIKLCFLNFRDLFYKNLLNNLIDTVK